MSLPRKALFASVAAGFAGAHPGPKPLEHSTCPGKFEVSGHGMTHLIPTGWGNKGAALVEVKGNALYANHGSRAYFAKNCTAGRYSNEDYTNENLLGKTMRFDVDLDNAGCGCNVALYLVSMAQNSHPSQCKDYYCDANNVCGESCAEIDIMEANTKAWHSTLHTQFDHGGLGGGLGGGEGWNGPRDFAKWQYGPGSKCIDTTKPFTVEVGFPKDWSGGMSAMDIKLSQPGSPCPLSLHLGEYPGNAELGRALAAGMTPVFSYWSSDKMLWMDGVGPDGQGWCQSDNPSPCMDKKPSVSNFEVVSEGAACDERCKVGRCEKFADGEEEGNCRWFFGSVTKDGGTYTPSHYRCKVDDCSKVPKGEEGFSSCIEEPETPPYYRISDRNYPCQTKKSAEEEKAEIERIKKEKAAEKAKEQKEKAALSKKCPATFEAPGLDTIAMVPSGWAGGTGAPIVVNHGQGGTGAITIDMDGRAFFADKCTPGEYDRADFKSLKLLGKKLKYTVDMSKAGCGCAAEVQLVAQIEDKTDCGDYYCNANAVCGVGCTEIDIMQANNRAFRATLHTEYDHFGSAAGYGGGDGWMGPRDFGKKEYGPGAKCVDTRRPFDVEASFEMNAKGELGAMKINMTQRGSSCDVHFEHSGYEGMDTITAALQDGMTLVVSYWSKDDLLWMDGPGSDNSGPCTGDDAAACGETVTFSKFSVTDLKSQPKLGERGKCVGDYRVAKECVAKFTYQDEEYTGCTDKHAKGRFWCGHDEKYKSGEYSWCDPCEEVVGERVIGGQKISGHKVLQHKELCGGLKFYGKDKCIDGFHCQFANEWWSDCQPDEPEDTEWACVHYEKGQNSTWCGKMGKAGITDGFEYEFNAGIDSSCGKCHCCKRAPVCYDGWLPHQKCATEFSYDDNVYVGCTTDDASETDAWCSLEPNYNGAFKPCKKCSSKHGVVKIIEKDDISHGSMRGLGNQSPVKSAAFGFGIASALVVMVAAVAMATKRFRGAPSNAGESYTPTPMVAMSTNTVDAALLAQGNAME